MRWERKPVWHESVLELPQMRAELKRLLEEEVLDMDFEDINHPTYIGIGVHILPRRT